ncbi:MAG: hypothetical protein IJJ69_08555 [Oscillospiraceae bacterium]|nr:hypothetical protein [Oscillospiraceae bacterium]
MNNKIVTPKIVALQNPKNKNYEVYLEKTASEIEMLMAFSAVVAGVYDFLLRHGKSGKTACMTMISIVTNIDEIARKPEK